MSRLEGLDIASPVITDQEGRRFTRQIFLPVAHRLSLGNEDWHRVESTNNVYTELGSISVRFHVVRDTEENSYEFELSIKHAEPFDENWKPEAVRLFTGTRYQYEGELLNSDDADDEELEQIEEDEVYLQTECDYMFNIESKEVAYFGKSMGFGFVDYEGEYIDFETGYHPATDDVELAVHSLETHNNIEEPMFNIVQGEVSLKSVTLHDLDFIKATLTSVGLLRARRKKA